MAPPDLETALPRFMSGQSTGDVETDQNLVTIAANQGLTEFLGGFEKQLGIPGLEEKRQEQLLAAQEERPLTGSELLATAILQIAPILIGSAIGGDEGGAIGAKSGLIGADFLRTESKELGKRERARAQLEAKSLGDQISDRKKQAFDFLKLGFDAEEGRLDRASREQAARIGAQSVLSAAEIQAGIGALDKDARKIVNEATAIAAQARSTFAEIREIDPALLDEGFHDEKGRLSISKTASVVKDRFANILAGNESDFGKAKQAIRRFVSEYQRKISGLQTTNQEFERLKAQIEGEGIIPRLIPNMLESIERIVGRAREEALAAALVQRQGTSRGGSSAETINQIFDLLDMNMPSRSPNAGGLDEATVMVDGKPMTRSEFIASRSS
jgi:gas vesicle protein